MPILVKQSSLDLHPWASWIQLTAAKSTRRLYIEGRKTSRAETQAFSSCTYLSDRLKTTCRLKSTAEIVGAADGLIYIVEQWTYIGKAGSAIRGESNFNRGCVVDRQDE